MTEIHKVTEYKQAKNWIWEERKHILQFVIFSDLKSEVGSLFPDFVRICWREIEEATV